MSTDDIHDRIQNVDAAEPFSDVLNILQLLNDKLTAAEKRIASLEQPEAPEREFEEEHD